MSNLLPPYCPETLRRLSETAIVGHSENVKGALRWGAERIEILMAEIGRLNKSIAWRCSSCGCAFPDGTGTPEGLVGVTRCAKCYLVEVLTRERDQAQAALKFTQDMTRREAREGRTHNE